MEQRPLLDSRHRTADVAKKSAEFHKETLDAVRAAIAREKIVVVGMSQNPVVKKARAALREANLEFTYLEYGSYFSEWRRRLAIKMWSGWPTFPQVFVRGALVGGNEELRAAIADGSLRARLESTEGAIAAASPSASN
jgi:monothiol glutaredoxin